MPELNQYQKKIRQVLERGITVADLLKTLKDMPPNAVPVFVCDYGDYCHTQQALPITEIALLTDDSKLQLVVSGYSRSGIALDDLDEDDIEGDPNPEMPPIVYLS